MLGRTQLLGKLENAGRIMDTSSNYGLKKRFSKKKSSWEPKVTVQLLCTRKCTRFQFRFKTFIGKGEHHFLPLLGRANYLDFDEGLRVHPAATDHLARGTLYSQWI